MSKSVFCKDKLLPGDVGWGEWLLRRAFEGWRRGERGAEFSLRP